MKRTEKTVTKFIIIIILISMMFPGSVSAAGKKNVSGKKQIIFLLDASRSMQEDGQWSGAADSVCMIASALPGEYEVALLVYNTEIVCRAKFGKINQKTRRRLENIKLQGYTAPSVALEKAVNMFDADAADKRVVFISDGEISMREPENTKKETIRFKNIADTAADQEIKIDMFVIPDGDMENQVAYGTKITSGKLYTAGKKQTVEETAAEYLFQTLQTEKIELGQAVSDAGDMTIDLQDTYMQSATILFLAEEAIKDFHVTGQCEHLNMMQGNKFAVAKLENPLEKQVVTDYILARRGGVHAYLVKEYYLTADTHEPDTLEEGLFAIKTDIVNHQDKTVLDAGHIKNSVYISVNGKPVSFDVENGSAVIRYRTERTAEIEMETDIRIPGCVLHCKKNTRTIELAVPPSEEEPDYTVLLTVVAVLATAVLLLSVIYGRNRLKKKSAGETDTADTGHKQTPVITKHDFSGQVTVYLLKGEQEEDFPPCSIRLFNEPRKNITFDWIKERCGIRYSLADADKIRFSGGKEHSLCFRNSGTATVMKENRILEREKKYFLYYGEKLLLVFNDGGTEIELHYKNIKPGER